MEATDSSTSEVHAAHYFAGIVGTSIVRRWYEDGAFNEVRLQELADLIAGRHEFPHSLVLQPQEHDLLDGYARWAETYDGPNPLIEAEEPHVHAALAPLLGPGVRALDAACGTGRHAAHMAAHGCDVDGVDQSAEMLEVAGSKVPTASFHQAELQALPFESGTFDVATCALALCHLPEPSSAVVELGRVLRPGGTLVVTDPHPSAAMLGGQAFFGGIVPGEPMRFVRNHAHTASTWLRAFRIAGLEVVDCLEPPFTDAQVSSSPAAIMFPAAAAAATEGLSGMWVWHLQRRS